MRRFFAGKAKRHGKSGLGVKEEGRALADAPLRLMTNPPSAGFVRHARSGA